MVDPIPNDDRVRSLRWAKFGTVALVGVSSGLIAVQGDAPVEFVAGAVGVGLLVGAALVWYLFPNVDAIAPAARRR